MLLVLQLFPRMRRRVHVLRLAPHRREEALRVHPAQRLGDFRDQLRVAHHAVGLQPLHLREQHPHVPLRKRSPRARTEHRLQHAQHVAQRQRPLEVLVRRRKHLVQGLLDLFVAARVQVAHRLHRVRRRRAPTAGPRVVDTRVASLVARQPNRRRRGRGGTPRKVLLAWRKCRLRERGGSAEALLEGRAPGAQARQRRVRRLPEDEAPRQLERLRHALVHLFCINSPALLCAGVPQNARLHGERELSVQGQDPYHAPHVRRRDADRPVFHREGERLAVLQHPHGGPRLRHGHGGSLHGGLGKDRGKLILHERLQQRRLDTLSNSGALEGGADLLERGHR
mmetsp:Transcript_279/g.478  ORF Transcript_279/g.478 Transcript_279/m.478 type:complete len:339 (+) Transcript_279:2273-3289(+)